MDNSAERAVKHIATENFNSYKKEWKNGDNYIDDLSQGYWEERREEEIERDNELGVSEEDYYRIIENALIDEFEDTGAYDVHVWYSSTFRGSMLGDTNQEVLDAYKTSIHAKAIPAGIAKSVVYSANPDEDKRFIVTKAGTREIADI